MAFKVKIIGLHQACFITLLHKECERLENEPKQKECITLAFEKEQSSSCVSLCIFITGASLTVRDIADMQCQKLLCTSSGWPCHLAITRQPRVRRQWEAELASPTSAPRCAPHKDGVGYRDGHSWEPEGMLLCKSSLIALPLLLNSKTVAMQFRECGSQLSTEEQSHIDVSCCECVVVALFPLFPSSECSPGRAIHQSDYKSDILKNLLCYKRLHCFTELNLLVNK